MLNSSERPKSLDKWIIQITKDSIDTKTTNDNLITNFTLWDKAYHIFLSIHSANPLGNNGKLITDLLSYRETVLELYKSNGNFAKYDQLFRRYVQNSGNRCYNVRLTDLYQRCLSSPRVPNESPQARSNQPPSYEILCRKFQEGACTYRFCKFEHRCEKCSYRSHGSKDCRVQTRRASYPFKPPSNAKSAPKAANASGNRQAGSLFGGI